jgi:dihydroneopterin aldolase/D-erythro-7,8-dihydroneopterin triphosphate epimerase
MPDRVYIQDLLCRCIVGINPEEREKKQDVIINIAIDVDLRAASKSDDIKDTVDYKGLKLRIVETVEQSTDFLIERLAQRIADLCLSDSRVDRVKVRVDKPGALRFAKTVAVELERARGDGE